MNRLAQLGNVTLGDDTLDEALARRRARIEMQKPMPKFAWPLFLAALLFPFLSLFSLATCVYVTVKQRRHWGLFLAANAVIVGGALLMNTLGQILMYATTR